MVDIGDHVLFVDASGMTHHSLIIAVWDNRENHGQGPIQSGKNKIENPPVNLVFIAYDNSKVNAHGNQVERRDSVVHEKDKDAQEEYYKYP